MYWKRWLTAIVIIPPLILLTLKAGTMWFTIATMGVGILAYWEYLRIVNHGHNPPPSRLILILLLVAGCLVLWAVYQNSVVYLAVVLTLALTVNGLFSIIRFKADGAAPFVMVKQLFGLVYISLMLSFLVLIHQGPKGPVFVIFLLWVVAWGDTGALYVGTYFGRHKLAPAVSPKKTIEGSLGGLAANVVFGYLFKLVFLPELSGLACILFVLSVGIVGQVGDLFESQFKRASGVKDSGALLPGHGGILDRIDAILFAAPVAYLLKEYLLP